MSSRSFSSLMGMFHISSARRISFSFSVPERSRSTYWNALNMSEKREFSASDADFTNAEFFNCSRVGPWLTAATGDADAATSTGAS